MANGGDTRWGQEEKISSLHPPGQAIVAQAQRRTLRSRQMPLPLPRGTIATVPLQSSWCSRMMKLGMLIDSFK
jgi:hypothetical protein